MNNGILSLGGPKAQPITSTAKRVLAVNTSYTYLYYSTSNTIVFDNIESDDLGSYNTTNGQYTIAENGIYYARANFVIDNGIALGTVANITLYSITNNQEYFLNTSFWSIGDAALRGDGSSMMYLSKGETVCIRCFPYDFTATEPELSFNNTTNFFNTWSLFKL